MLLVPLLAAVVAAQTPLADLPNLVPNGGFEDGTADWRVSIGLRSWDEAAGVAEVLDRDADAGRRCLRLNAVGRDGEVDATAGPLPVEPETAYLLLARVKQLAGEGGYKVTIDWLDAAGKHLAYANDWQGNDHPVGFADHGGVVLSPTDAAQAVLILGVSKGAECFFDEITLSPLPEGPGPDVPDGSGRVDSDIPPSIEAGAHGTFRFVYHAGEQGLPTGASVYLRRDNIDPRWSVPQLSDPAGPGYLTVEASNGARCLTRPGSASTVPCVSRVTVVYPPLEPGDTLTLTYGDPSEGGPGAQAQPKAEPGLHFVLSVDGDRDDRPLDLPDTPAFDVVPGRFAQLGLLAPVVAEVGSPFLVALEARDAQGNRARPLEGPARLTTEDGGLAGEVRFTAADRGLVRARITLHRAGTRVLKAQAGTVTAQQVIIFTHPPARPERARAAGAWAGEAEGTYVLENPRLRLLLPPNDFGYGVAVLEARNGQTWARAGVLASLGQLWTGPAGATPENAPVWLPRVEALNEGDTSRLRLSGELEAGGATWDVQAECALQADARHLDVTCRATPRGAVQLCALYGPSLFAGDGDFGAAKQSALFPGLEYLAGAEASSGEYGIVPPHSLRTVPDPRSITLPLMAVTAGGVGAGLFWDPGQTWTPGRSGPSACFACPERWDDRDSHFLGLLAPSVAEGLPTNARYLPEPASIPAGRTLSLSASLVALAPASDVTDIVRYWFEANGLPEPPPPPRSPDAQADITARGFLEAAWDVEKRGWHNALADPWGAAYNEQIALRLRHHARVRPQSPLTPKIEAQLAEAFEAAGGTPGYHLAFHTGDPARAWEAERAVGLRDALGMSADGSYAYHPHSGNKLFTQAQAKSLGREGEVNVGTCVMGLEPLMRRALITGDPFLIAQGEKGLAFIDQFTRPQGAEHWEVPLACPNLRASALALRCYLYGYLLTGKEHYLERARFWATTGLPFIYTWNPDDRPVMRYASISVMGTTLHTHTWFGKPVQWVGLVYADALLELATHDDTFPWRRVAEGILACAMQMQKTEADACGHVGFYPDAWDVLTGREAYHWCLAPTLIAEVSDALTDCDPKASTTILRLGRQRLHLTAPGSLAGATFEADTLRCATRYLPGGEYQVLVSPLAAVEAVLVDGAPLDRGDFEVVPPGLLRIRVRQAGDEAQLEVRGCRFTQLAAALNLAGIANGGFEEGLQGWAPSDPGAVSPSTDAHSGENALLLDARGLTREVQCPSTPIAVQEGKSYELVSWVKQLAGEGKYKVTIDWLGLGGHLSYANDWQGADRPAAYARHGGRFTAPAGAKAVVIILGVHPGTACLFDDVALDPAP